MNLRRLSHLLAVAEAQSFSKACDIVHLSQPALCRSIQALEAELGIQLLERKYGRVELTSYSAPVIEQARRILAEERALGETVRRIQGLEEGEIHVGFGPVAAAVALQPVMQEVVRRHRGLRVAIEIAHSSALIDQLRQGRLDIAISDMRSIVRNDDLRITELPTQRVVFVANADHVLCRAKSLKLGDLAGHPVGAPTLPYDLAREFSRHGFDPWPALTCDDFRTLVRLAATSDLVAMVPEILAREVAANGSLSILRVKMPFEQHAFPCIATSGRHVSGPASRLVVELIKRHLGVE